MNETIEDFRDEHLSALRHYGGGWGPRALSVRLRGAERELVKAGLLEISPPGKLLPHGISQARINITPAGASLISAVDAALRGEISR